MRHRWARSPFRRGSGLALVTAALVTVSACGTAEVNVAVPIARPDTPQVSAAAPADPPTSDSDAPEPAPTDVDDETTAPVPDPTSMTPATTIAPPPPTTLPPTTLPPTTTPPTTTPPTTLPPLAVPDQAVSPDAFVATTRAFERIAGANAGASMTVVRAGEIVFSRASGTTIDGQPANGDTPMVVASVSKIVVALGIARLHEQGFVDVDAPVPWADLGLAPDAGWDDVTVRELLDHTSGLAKARYSWFTGDGTCRDYVPSLLTAAPNGDRGRWVYSNGNYCLLGLLLEARTGQPLDAALQDLVFDPIGTDGVHLTVDGLRPGDLPHSDDVARLSRLGGAGTLIVSTDDTAMLLGRMTPADVAILQAPGVFTDQYGIGHTGTVDGAKACIWVLEYGATVVSATIAGSSVASGGGVCDIVVPAVASDLGLGSAKPVRTP